MRSYERLISFIFIVVIITLLTTLNVTLKFGGNDVDAQVFGTNFLWQDSLATTTSETDCTFTQRWEQLTLKADASIYFRAAIPGDTASWSSREWTYLDPLESVSFGPGTPIGRLTFKAAVGTCNTYLLGYKKVRRF